MAQSRAGTNANIAQLAAMIPVLVALVVIFLLQATNTGLLIGASIGIALVVTVCGNMGDAPQCTGC